MAAQPRIRGAFLCYSLRRSWRRIRARRRWPGEQVAGRVSLSAGFRAWVVCCRCRAFRWVAGSCSSLAWLLAVPGCDAARSVALEAGGRRYPLLTLTLTLILILAFVVPACAVTGGAVPDLAPPGPHDGGVRSGTAEPASRRVAVLAGAANAPGLGRTVAARPVGGLCGRCAGAVRRRRLLSAVPALS